MSRQLNVLFVSSEVEPFSKTGGLADVSGSLPKALNLLGHDVRVATPLYGFIPNRLKARTEDLQDIQVPVGSNIYLASVKSVSGSETPAHTYFIDNQILFNRPGIYGDPATQQDYGDNDERFIFFSRGVLEFLQRLSWRPDIIHCNDWQTGLIAPILKTTLAGNPFFSQTKTVFTIHNIAYQGTFSQESFWKTFLPPELLFNESVSSFGHLNCMKAGLVFADSVTTVSRRYALEIQTEEFGYGLHHVAQMRSPNLHGILNGVDYCVWDPSVDTLIPQRYTAATFANKLENKRSLLAQMNLPFDESVPLIGIVSRLAHQKGFDLLMQVFEPLVKMGIQLVILGSGERKYAEFFSHAERAFPRQFALRLGFDNALAHLIEAGSDIFLMPSLYEPCGLNQIYSLRYGTVPIVRATGGLDDTIEEFQPGSHQGTGFKFAGYDPGQLLHAVHRAVNVFRDREQWIALALNGMKKDYSWEVSARKYVDLYKSLVKE